MSRFLRLSVCAFAVLALAGAVQAATVEFAMVVIPHQGIWRVYAWASGGDNDGILGYNIGIVNYIEGTQYMPRSSVFGFSAAGFTIGGDPIPNSDTGDSLFAGMNSTNPASVWYGVGSPDTGDPGSGSRIEGPTVEPPFEGQQVPWWDDQDIDTSMYGPAIEGGHFVIPGSGILVGEGTYDNRGPSPGFGPSTSANVWELGAAAQNGTGGEAAIVIVGRVLVGFTEPRADFDLDGDVDGDDLLHWQTGFGITSGATKLDGDYDDDGDVDGDDFLGWQSQFGSSSGLASAAVPEPASLVLLIATLIGAILVKRRQ